MCSSPAQHPTISSPIYIHSFPSLQFFTQPPTFQSFWHFKVEQVSLEPAIASEPFFFTLAAVHPLSDPSGSFIDPSTEHSDSANSLHLISFLTSRTGLNRIGWKSQRLQILLYIRYSCIKLRLVWSFWIKNPKPSSRWSKIFYLNFDCFSFKAITVNKREFFRFK